MEGFYFFLMKTELCRILSKRYGGKNVHLMFLNERKLNYNCFTKIIYK